MLPLGGCHHHHPIKDTKELVKGSDDGTKKVRIEADEVSPDTTRTITMPDQDVDLQWFALRRDIEGGSCYRQGGQR